MKNYSKITFIIVAVLFNSAVFAQGSDDDTGGGNLDGNDVPVNGQLIYLIIAGIIFAMYTFNKFRKSLK